MKDTFLKFRASDDERARWKSAVAQEGRTVSDVCRKALDRFADRVEKKGERNEDQAS